MFSPCTISTLYVRTTGNPMVQLIVTQSVTGISRHIFVDYIEENHFLLQRGCRFIRGMGEICKTFLWSDMKEDTTFRRGRIYVLHKMVHETQEVEK